MLVELIAALAIGAEPPARFTWPKPELIDEIAISDVIKSDGVPVRLHSFRSKLSAEALLQIYANAFDRAGFFIALDQKRVTAEPHITALDWRTKISYSAILSPQRDGTTECMLGEAAVGKRKVTAPDFAPPMPDARDVVRIDQETDRLISFTAREKADGVLRFYEEVLPSGGFTPSKEEPNVYGKGAEKIRVITKANADGTTTVVLMHRRSE